MHYVSHILDLSAADAEAAAIAEQLQDSGKVISKLLGFLERESAAANHPAPGKKKLAPAASQPFADINEFCAHLELPDDAVAQVQRVLGENFVLSISDIAALSDADVKGMFPAVGLCNRIITARDESLNYE